MAMRAMRVASWNGSSAEAPALAGTLAWAVAAVLALAPPALAQEAAGAGGEAPTTDGAAGSATMTDKDGNTSQMSHDEAVSKVIQACKDNPQQKACVDLRAACEQKRPNWPGDMARICPELVGAGGGGGSGGGISAQGLGEDDGGETYGEPRPSNKNEATLDKVARMCHRVPDNKTCVQIRSQCHAKYANLPPGGQRICRQIGAGPKPDAPMGMHTAYAFQWVKVADSARVSGVESIAAGHISGRGFSTDGPYASAFDITIGKAKAGWYWDFSLMGGLGIQPGRRLSVGVVGGLRGSGITKGELETAWGVPVELHATYLLAPKLSLLAYARPIWHFGETKRKDDATIGSFADEFELGAHVVWARVNKPGATNMGLMGGVVYHELRDTAYLGLRVGFGFANRP